MLLSILILPTVSMEMAATISQLNLSHVTCPVQQAALSWWKSRRGVAELDRADYLEMAPHLQLAVDAKRPGAPCFFYVGRRSLPAKLLGDKFNSRFHAGRWWDDGGYAEAVSESYQEVSATGEPMLEQITAPIDLPPYVQNHKQAVLDYARLCLPTFLEDGQRTFTVIATGSISFGKPEMLLRFSRMRSRV